jgi:pre-mRNA-splicing factor SYF1
MEQLSKMLDKILKIEPEISELPEASTDLEDLAIKRVENLIDRREILLNSCNLRQSPNTVSIWMERLDLLKDDLPAYVKTFHEALTKINPFVAEGDVSSIWIRFATFYEKLGDLTKANMVFWKAVRSEFRKIDEYVHVWVIWAEMLLRQGAYKDAINILQYVRIQLFKF